MKLKYINVNGFGILVDESAEIKKGDLVVLDYPKGYNIITVTNKPFENAEFINSEKKIHKCKHFKIIFAEKELNLDVPVLPNWRDWEVENAADLFSTDTTKVHPADSYIAKQGFIAGYNHNKAKYTEEDLRKALNIVRSDTYKRESIDEIIQSLQKVSNYKK